MLNKTRAKAKKFLYELKENAKSIGSGTVLEKDKADITELIDIGFCKMEYLHTLETKYSISLYLEEMPEEHDLSQTRSYAEFSLYVMLIGYLDAVIAICKDFCDKHGRNFEFHYVGEHLSTASILRDRVIKDYLEGTAYPDEEYIKAITEESSFAEKMEKLMSLIQFNEKNSHNERILISELIQAYMEGFKTTGPEEKKDIIHVSSFYEERQKAYIKYKSKCYEDAEEVKAILQKQNKPLL